MFIKIQDFAVITAKVERKITNYHFKLCKPHKARSLTNKRTSFTMQSLFLLMKIIPKVCDATITEFLKTTCIRLQFSLNFTQRKPTQMTSHFHSSLAAAKYWVFHFGHKFSFFFVHFELFFCRIWIMCIR